MKYKRIIICLVILLIIYFLLNNKKEDEIVLSHEEKRAIYISYIEYQTYLKGKTETIQKMNIIEMINNLRSNNFNMILLHVRPFSDAIYNSKIYPTSSTVCNKEGCNLSFDILEYFIKLSHQYDIEVHAWINPYRIRSDNNIESISKTNPAFNWLNTNNVEVAKGIYYNPASSDVLNLIINGVEELINNYDIDGVHYDDYFYPTKTIDKENYENYKQSGGSMSLKEYRYQNINNLIKETFKVVKDSKKNIVFGISPAGNIENNKNTEYLDIEYLLSETDYLDYVMPQIYFGFNNTNKPYVDTVNDWNNLIKNKNTKLYVALAPYKLGLTDKYAGAGKDEWINSNDILKRQITYARVVSKYDGFSLFRYEHLFNKKKHQSNSQIEIDNMLSLFNY